jgi:hypothetical protein
MKHYFYSLLLVAWSAISPALQEPGHRARIPKLGEVVDLGSLKSRVPVEWAEEKPSEANSYKQYRLEPVNGPIL